MIRYLTRRLQSEHARLEAALVREIRRPKPDARLIRAIKKRKLRVKDRLQALESKAAEGASMADAMVQEVSRVRRAADFQRNPAACR